MAQEPTSGIREAQMGQTMKDGFMDQAKFCLRCNVPMAMCTGHYDAELTPVGADSDAKAKPFLASPIAGLKGE